MPLHDRADHHRGQLHVDAALAARRPLVMGAEMCPARLDPLLARWSAAAWHRAHCSCGTVFAVAPAGSD